MGFDEKLNISDMTRCAKNFYETLDKALSTETELSQTSTASEDDLAFTYRFARSAMIHVFEITVENSWKMMQRWVKINADNKIHEKPKRELFRTAHQCGLISDPVIWWEFYDGRNKTSHTYHESVAEDVYNLAKRFKEPLRDFISRLEERA